MFKVYLEYVQSVFRVCSGYVQSMFRVYSVQFLAHLVCQFLAFFIMDTKPSKIVGTIYGCIYASRYEGQIVRNTC